jgi:hypothetical protein
MLNMDSNERVSLFENAPPFVIGQDAAAIRAGELDRQSPLARIRASQIKLHCSA